ncbi:MAG: CpsD/CapB family tyrosine-protein kinase, partial [Actinomycetota bacterium]
MELGALGVPMLGTAPVARSADARSAGGNQLFGVNTSGGDAYRRLQGSLVFNLDSENKSAVLVAGVKKANPSTSVAANVGATAARAGRRTLVVGADLRNAQLAPHLGLDAAAPGLSDVILDGASLAGSILTVDGIENLSVLTAGTHLDRPADVLQSEAFARLLAAVTADYDLVVIEAPPVLKVADAVDIAALCDGTVVVADRRSDARQAIADSVE